MIDVTWRRGYAGKSFECHLHDCQFSMMVFASSDLVRMRAWPFTASCFGRSRHNAEGLGSTVDCFHWSWLVHFWLATSATNFPMGYLMHCPTSKWPFSSCCYRCCCRYDVDGFNNVRFSFVRASLQQWAAQQMIVESLARIEGMIEKVCKKPWAII